MAKGHQHGAVRVASRAVNEKPYRSARHSIIAHSTHRCEVLLLHSLLSCPSPPLHRRPDAAVSARKPAELVPEQSAKTVTVHRLRSARALLPAGCATERRVCRNAAGAEGVAVSKEP